MRYRHPIHAAGHAADATAAGTDDAATLDAEITALAARVAGPSPSPVDLGLADLHLRRAKLTADPGTTRRPRPRQALAGAPAGANGAVLVLSSTSAATATISGARSSSPASTPQGH